MREPPGGEMVVQDDQGITPACAGTTDRGGIAPHQRRDHPRVCGNHARPSFPSFSGRGSPPRVREPPAIPVRIARRIGITPACAGTTASGSRAGIRAEDHPRVCGNHHQNTMRAVVCQGSPPRVREPQEAGREEHAPLGITPACAGTTHESGPQPYHLQDHPRVCGNHFVI